MTELNSIQTIKTHQITYLSLENTIKSLIKQLSSPEYSKNSILQKPVLSKLITLSLSQNAKELHCNKCRFKNLFEHLSDDLILYMLEELSEHIETKGYTTNFLTIEMVKNLRNYKNNFTDHQSLIKPLKTIFEKTIFDSNFDIPMTALLPTINKLPQLSMGDILSNMFPIICTSLRASNKKMNNNQPIDKQTYEETFDFFKYLLMIPVNLALKYQEYNTSICPQTFVSATGSYRTISDSCTFKLGSSDLNLCLKTFDFKFNYKGNMKENYKNILEYIYQLLMSLICQNVPCLYPEELDKDTFNLISCYKLKTNYINILIKFYIRTLKKKYYFSSLNSNLLENAFYIYSKVPCKNRNVIRKYLNVVDTFLSYMNWYINHKYNMNNTKSLITMSKTILLVILNVYSSKKKFFVNRAFEVFYKLLNKFSMFDKMQFARFVNYFVDYMLDIFIGIFNKNNKSRYYVMIILTSLINGIILLEKPMREELLEKFDKWFILALQNFIVNKGRLSRRVDNYWITFDCYSYLNVYESYFKKKVSINFLVEKLSWFTSHDVDLKILLIFINKTNKHISRETEPFSDIVKLHLANSLITNIYYNDKGNMIIPANYHNVLNKIEREENEEFCNRIESLTQMYMRK